MNLELLDEFCMMTKFRNLSEAAKELHVTQPVLSRHLNTLEHEVGFELLDRSTTPMQLTPGGEAFLSHASVIACEYRRLCEHMSMLKRHPLEAVRIGGALCSLASPFIREAKNSFEGQQANVSIKLCPLGYQTSFELIREGRLDVCFEPFSDLIDVHGLASMPVVREPSFILVSESHPLASRDIVNPDDLCSMNFVYPISNRYHGIRKHLQGICKRYALLGDVPKTLRPANVESLEEMVLSGLGDCATMLPRSMAIGYASVPHSGYVALPFSGVDSEYDLRAFFLEEPNRATRQFIEVMSGILDGSEGDS